MIISPFTPLFFSPSTDKFGAKSKYQQKFASTDRIFIEVLTATNETTPELQIHNLITSEKTSLVLSVWQMNEDKILYFYTVTGLESGYYEIVINDLVSEPFKVTNDKNELAETTLIQYSMKDNKQRLDAIFWIDGMQYFIDFRVPGGFKDGGWSFGVDNEQFVTSDEDVVELFSHEYTTQIFTLGNAMGCPVWFAELLNRILCCTYVYFDGVRYARKESNVPELNQQIEGLKSFVFQQMLQKVKTMSPTLEWNNQVSIRGLGSDVCRVIDNGELRSVKFGGEDAKFDIPAPPDSIYVNLENCNYVANGTTIADYAILELTEINKFSSRSDNYWILCALDDTDILDKYLDRNTGINKLTVSGLDNLKKILGIQELELRIDFVNGGHPVNGVAVPLVSISGNAVSTDGSFALNPLSKDDITGDRSMAVYLRNVPPVVTVNVAEHPLNIKLTYMNN